MSFITDGVRTALPKPEGYVVDFDNPQVNMKTANLVTAGIGIFLSSLFLAQRLFVKIVIHRSVGIDDYCVTIAWAFSIAMQALIIHGFAEGTYGIHAWELPIQRFGRYVMFANYIQAIVYVFPTVLSKVALLIFYIKLQNRQRWYQWAIWATMFVTIGSNLGILFSIVFSCDPIAKAYDINVTEGTCIDRAAVFKATAAFGIVTDVLIFAIPIPMVIGLQLSMRKKLGLLVIFGIGSATVVTSVVRLVLLIQNLDAGDLSWIGGPVFLWIIIEANLLIICACLPTLKHFVQIINPNALGSSRTHGTSGGGITNPKSGALSYGLGTNSGNGANGLPANTNGIISNGAGVGGVFGRPKPRRDNYHGFDGESDYRMETLIEGNADLGDADYRHRRRQRDAEMNGGHHHHGMALQRDPSSGDRSSAEGDGDGGGRDDDSAKAIIQTKTLQIHYEDRVD